METNRKGRSPRFVVLFEWPAGYGEKCYQVFLQSDESPARGFVIGLPATWIVPFRVCRNFHQDGIPFGVLFAIPFRKSVFFPLVPTAKDDASGGSDFQRDILPCPTGLNDL